ncbi:MAG: transketolase [Gemmatimonadetes bacterium]|jgi:transketolase|nr:transketolase [Gemmatimonadota bacterium]MBT5056120.1 transketolase [Gemmatimonadota bacterium]MBT5141105.1 transketolase [Gemmatimonadota bacterium]MBT5586467.1 transketolase [Gemmatimonadota bacterium]MBT5964674.1 transketolase [Gemmatimonadota bacterium]
MDSTILSVERHRQLRQTAIQIRRGVVESVHHAGAGHLGGPMSATELLTALYFEVMNIDPQQPDDPGRDRFILSKGHCSIGLYATLAARGYFPEEELKTFDAVDSRLQGHPDMSVLPGIDMSTGSLGQGLSPGIGMALAARIQRHDYHTWVMLGDGDSQEGQVWEAAFVAQRYGLDNLTAILDLNGLQQFGWATGAGYESDARQPPQDNPAQRWAAFGWHVLEIDGHDFEQILTACRSARAYTEGPTLIIARTVKGKGISYMENDYSWHSKPVTDEDLRVAREELAQQEAAL